MKLESLSHGKFLAKSIFLNIFQSNKYIKAIIANNNSDHK